MVIFRGGASHMTRFPGILFWVSPSDLSYLVPSSQLLGALTQTNTVFSCKTLIYIMNVDLFTVRIDSLFSKICLLPKNRYFFRLKPRSFIITVSHVTPTRPTINK